MTYSKILLVSFFMFLVNNILGQDTVIFNSGIKAFVKVVEINNRTVKYAENGSSGIEVKEVSRSSINHIIYSNGVQEILEPATEVYADPKRQSESPKIEFVNVKPEKVETTYGKNMVAVNVFEFIFTNFGFSYERLFLNNRLSIKIPVAFGMGGKPVINDYENNASFTFAQNKNYSLGLELNTYPFPANKSNFYFGISALTGGFRYYKYNYNSYKNGSSPNYFDEHLGIIYSCMFHVGGNIGLSEHLFIGVKGAMGLQYQETIYVDYTKPRAQLDLNLGYRF